MKKFNTTIKVEVSVDLIASQLLDTIKDDEKHREMITETIVGTLLNQGRMTDLYNALNGYPNTLDFEVGDVVMCDDEAYQYVIQDNGEHRRKYVKIGQCTVVDIDVYRSAEKLKVEFSGVNSKGAGVTETAWVRHTSCNKIPVKGKKS